MSKRGFWVNRFDRCFPTELYTERRSGATPLRRLRDQRPQAMRGPPPIACGRFVEVRLALNPNNTTLATAICFTEMFRFDFLLTVLAVADPLWTWTIGPWQRAAMAAALAAGTCWTLGRALLPWLERHCPERVTNRLDALYALHRHKQDTPTMGGLFVVAAICTVAAVLCRNDDPAVVATLAETLGLAGVGWADDLAKRHGHGLTPGRKLLLQILVAAPAIGWWILASRDPALFVPFHGAVSLPEGALFALGLLCVVGSANAFNLTDGLDGLAAGCGVLAHLGLIAVMACSQWTRSDNPSAMPWEPMVLAAIGAGALAAFLWFNRFPARVFLGNTGALACGGMLGALAFTTGNALALLFVGGVFVVETLSVIVQRAARRFANIRVLRCAPLHHHWQLNGWDEPKIVRRFWLAAAVCATFAAALPWVAPPSNRQGRGGLTSPHSACVASEHSEQR